MNFIKDDVRTFCLVQEFKPVLEVVRRFSYNDIFKSTTKRLYRDYVDRERDEAHYR